MTRIIEDFFQLLAVAALVLCLGLLVLVGSAAMAIAIVATDPMEFDRGFRLVSGQLAVAILALDLTAAAALTAAVVAARRS